MKKGEAVEKYIREHAAELSALTDRHVLNNWIEGVEQQFHVGIYAELAFREPPPNSIQAIRRGFWFEVWSLRKGRFQRTLHEFTVW